MDEEELKLTDRPKEYFEWLKNHKNFPVDRYDIFMNKMKANGFKTLDINNRSGIRVINEGNNKMVDYYHRRQSVCFYVNGQQKWRFGSGHQFIIDFLNGEITIYFSWFFIQRYRRIRSCCRMDRLEKRISL